jgi:ribose 5-phosphate isomerase
MPSAAERDRQKRAAAARAADLVMPGMVLGLGSGSTAEFVLEAVVARVAQGLSSSEFRRRSEPSRGRDSWA